MTSVRVRGIYATALSKIMVDEGFRIVEASEKIQSRLGLDFDTTPCDVTIKDTDNPDEILVIGFPEEARRVFNTIVEKLEYVYKWESKLELHSVYTGLITRKQGDTCIVDIGGVEGTLYPCREEPGSRVVVGVKKPPLKPGETLVLTRNFRLVGKRVAIVHGESKITFSEHIYGQDVKARLSAIALSKLMGSGLGIHFRSSSKYASSDEIAREIEELLEEYKALLKKAEEVNAPCKLRHGEFLGIIGLTSLAKKRLDEYRRSVTFTLEYHHSLKSMGYSDLVDFAEDVMAQLGYRGENTSLGVLSHIYRALRESGRVEIIHIKPTGETLRLQQGRVVKTELSEDTLLVIIERVMKSPGYYDGLGVEKKPGDIDYMVVKSNSPIISHNYYRSGNWVGTYININTPPEFTATTIKYHDLLVDVVILPTGEVKVVDKEELDKLHENGVITQILYNYAMEAVNRVLANPSSYVYNPYKNQK